MKANENIKVGDALFGVDPQKLVIIRTNVIEISDGYGSVNQVHLSIYEKVKSLIKVAIDRFPFECNGILYFRSEDDAHKFIKTQIGI